MNIEVKKIVIATDGSENVKNAVNWGMDLAKDNGAMVSAIYVMPLAGVTLSMQGEMWSKALEKHLKDEGEKAISHVEEIGKIKGVRVESSIVEGKTPTDGIVNFAADNNADLIVMGTLGVTGLGHYLLGSVAENVVRHAKRPVLVVP